MTEHQMMMTIKIKPRIKILVLHWKSFACGLIFILVLCACRSNVMMVEGQEMTLGSFVVDFMEEYRIKHKFINIQGRSKCYYLSAGRGMQRSPEIEYVKFIQQDNYMGSDRPSLIEAGVKHEMDMGPQMIGKRIPSKRKGIEDMVYFKPLGHVSFVDGNGVAFGIRSVASQSIEENVAWIRSEVSGPNRRYRSSHFVQEPHAQTVGSTTWTTYSAYRRGSIVEVWLTPIGDSGYYIYIGAVLTRKGNERDWQIARGLVDGIIQSVVIERK